MNPDVLIIGAGPAGMSAALSLHKEGARVMVADEQIAAGGQVYRSVDRNSREHADGLLWLGSDYVHGQELVNEFQSTDIEVRYATSVWDISFTDARPKVGLVSGDHACFCQPKHVILATGAMERPTPFPGWTLPGVMTVGAAQTLFKESMLLPDDSTVIAGSGPLIYLFINQMIAAGQKPALILDTGPAKVAPENWGYLFRALKADTNAIFKGWSWLRNIKKAGIRHTSGVTALKARGDQRVQKIEYQRGNQTFEIDTRLLLVHDGVIPNTHLAMATGCQHRWNGIQNYWTPVLDDNAQSTQPGISIIGDSATIAGADAAVISGRVIGKQLALQLGLIDRARYQNSTQQDRQSLQKIAVLRQFLDNHYRPGPLFQHPDGETIICRCEQVSAADIRRVAALGCMGPNQAKAFTRCGMGPCMGRQCGNSVSQIFARFHDRDVGEIGHYRIRPPIKPLTLGQLANLDLTRS